MTTTEMAQPTFLLVDDDDYSLDFAYLMLGKLGFTQAQRIQMAHDAMEGLRTLDGMPQPPDFIICDVYMPVQDGFEFMAELAKRSYRGGVILVSGGNSQTLSAAHLLAVANGLNVLGALTKPLQQDKLRAMLFSNTASLLAT
jgi:CheY-like chemotaxis protein